MTTAAKPNTTNVPNLNVNRDQQKAEGLWRLALRRFRRHKMAMVGVVILVIIILYVTAGALFFTQQYSNYAHIGRSLEAPSAEFPFGTDQSGRDLLSRTIYGGQISLLIGVTAAFTSVIVGTLTGLVAGYFGGWVDAVISRVTEAILSIPSLLLLLLLSKAWGGIVPQITLFGTTFSGSAVVIIGVLGFTSWMSLSRIIRSQVLSLKNQDFVLAAKALGASSSRIIFQHILPNCISVILVYITLGVAGAILGEAYVSFLGVGVQPPTPTWGNILSRANEYVQTAPWMWLIPSAFIIITVVAINFIGDGLTDALDPRGKNN